MVTIPKPRFAETNVPIGISEDNYRDEIIDMQSHVLSDAIDRVSLKNFIRKYLFVIKKCEEKSLHVHLDSLREYYPNFAKSIMKYFKYQIIFGLNRNRYYIIRSSCFYEQAF